MTITINMTTPLNGQRQVNVDTDLVFDIVSDAYDLDLSTLVVKINGLPAILNGEFETFSNPFNLEVSETQTLNSGTFTVELEQKPNNLQVVITSDGEEVATPVRFDDNTNILTFEPPVSQDAVYTFDYVVNDFDPPSRFVTVLNDPEFLPGERVVVTDAYNSFNNVILSLDGKTYKLQDALANIVEDAYFFPGLPKISSLSRGYQGSIVNNNAPSEDDFTITIDPLSTFLRNRVVLVTVSIREASPGTTFERAVFTFRTSDTVPPQVFNLPAVIEDSQVPFTLVDILGNEVQTSSINLFLNGLPAIANGVILDPFYGNLFVRNPSEVDVYVRARQKYADDELITVNIDAIDGYGNRGFFSSEVRNVSKVPRVELIDIEPVEESVIDPRVIEDVSVFVINVRTDLPVEARFINISHIVPGTFNAATETDEHPTIAQGAFVEDQTGTLITGRDIFIKLDNLSVLDYNQRFDLRIFFQELDDDNEPVGLPFFERVFSYKTVSTRLGPFIDNFIPTLDQVASPTSEISFRVISVVDKDPVDTSTLNVVVNNLLAIDEGYFSNSFTGSITEVQNSEGNSVSVLVNPPVESPYEVGSTVAVDVDVQDQAGNLSTESFAFSITNTNVPIVTMTPSGGVFNDLIRITIAADQEAQIFYTLNGTVPNPGQVNTFVGTSPVENIPIFSQGVTQVKAIAINSAGIQSQVVTEIYDVNQFPPIVTITSPEDGLVQDITTVPVEYSIVLDRGFLSRVEFSLNGGPRTDVQNTLTESSVLITGLVSGTNTIQIFATDNAGNLGIDEVQVIVNPSLIDDFTVNFAPLVCPEFTTRVLARRDFFNNFIDTSTVIIIGYGKRREVLVDFAVGSGEDGFPTNFVGGSEPDGRHFQLNSFPVIESSLVVRLFRKGREIIVPARDYVIESSSGQIVLDHPLELGENLTIEYISAPDINSPEIFTSFEQEDLFIKHGQPSIENTLSLAAQMAFENGAFRVLAVQPKDLSEDAGWTETFTRLEKEEGYWIVPVLNNDQLSFYPTIRANAFNHALEMSQIKYRKERVVAAARINEEPNEFQNERISLTYVDLSPSITRIIQGEAQQLNPTFVAATIAGLHSGIGNIASPVTNRTVTGFTLGTRLKSPRLDLDRFVRQGFLPVQARAEGGYVFRGRTTTLSGSPILEEISIVRTTDFISKNLRRLLQDRFVGRNINSELLNLMENAANQFLAQQTSISTGNVTTIGVDSQEPRQINIAIQYTPLFPLNDMTVGVGFSATL